MTAADRTVQQVSVALTAAPVAQNTVMASFSFQEKLKCILRMFTAGPVIILLAEMHFAWLQRAQSGHYTIPTKDRACGHKYGCPGDEASLLRHPEYVQLDSELG